MNTSRVVILGAGYTGKELARIALKNNLEVVGTGRTEESLQALRDLGATAVQWSVGDDPAEWLDHVGPQTTLVYSIPTLFDSYEASEDIARHVEPLRQIIDVCVEQGGLDRFIYLSSTSVYGDHHGEWVDEATERRPYSPYGKMRADIEDYLLERKTSFPITIARLVGIYGPGRNLINMLVDGRYTLIEGAKKVTNRIHVHDIARAVLAIIERGHEGNRVFNITDGHPQPSRDLIEFICEETEIDPPPTETMEQYRARVHDPNRIARRQSSVRVLNDRLRRELQFDLVYPDAFAGYKAIIDAGSFTTDRDTAPVPG